MEAVAISKTPGLEELRMRREMVRVFVRKYRRELTILGAAALTDMNQFLEEDQKHNIDAYVSFVNDLSFDEMVGDQLKALWIDSLMKSFEDVVLGRKDFECIVESSMVDIDTYRELMTKY